jgi:hypothetical protein
VVTNSNQVKLENGYREEEIRKRIAPAENIGGGHWKKDGRTNIARAEKLGGGTSWRIIINEHLVKLASSQLKKPSAMEM